jgi:hypothetical protein
VVYVDCCVAEVDDRSCAAVCVALLFLVRVDNEVVGMRRETGESRGELVDEDVMVGDDTCTT